VVEATREHDGLRAIVCVSNAAHADAIADRVMQQLYSRGLHAVALDVYAGPRAIRRVVLTHGERRTEPLVGAPTGGACQAAPASEHRWMFRSVARALR